ncbi:MAG: DoxX family protein [Tepidisphaeraceae bacterium]|jgi:hypothetical protein
MQSSAAIQLNSSKMIWAGRIISALPVLLLFFSASMKLAKPPGVVSGFEHFGYPQTLIPVLGILEAGCAIVYLIPRTSVLGAILLTGFLGGATATHVRLLDPAFVMPVAVGVLVWLGLLLREPRLRPLIPLRKTITA